MKILFYDLETTGLDEKKHAIHQMSFIIDIDGEIKEKVDFKVQPYKGCIISKEALEVGNVTIEQLKTYPEHEEVYKKLIDLLSKYIYKFNKKDKFFLCGYNNSHFDNRFFRQFFLLNNDKYFGSWFWGNPLDVYILATQKLLAERHLMPNFKLMSVAEHLGIKVDEKKLHNAIYDVELTRDIYYKIK